MLFYGTNKILPPSLPEELWNSVIDSGSTWKNRGHLFRTHCKFFDFVSFVSVSASKDFIPLSDLKTSIIYFFYLRYIINIWNQLHLHQCFHSPGAWSVAGMLSHVLKRLFRLILLHVSGPLNCWVLFTSIHPSMIEQELLFSLSHCVGVYIKQKDPF